MLNKVSEVILYFWIVKILCTTVGETAADYPNTTMSFALSKTTYVMAAPLPVVLFVQLALRKYVTGRYWLGAVRWATCLRRRPITGGPAWGDCDQSAVSRGDSRVRNLSDRHPKGLHFPALESAA